MIFVCKTGTYCTTVYQNKPVQFDTTSTVFTSTGVPGKTPHENFLKETYTHNVWGIDRHI